MLSYQIGKEPFSIKFSIGTFCYNVTWSDIFYYTPFMFKLAEGVQNLIKQMVLMGPYTIIREHLNSSFQPSK